MKRILMMVAVLAMLVCLLTGCTDGNVDDKDGVMESSEERTTERVTDTTQRETEGDSGIMDDFTDTTTDIGNGGNGDTGNGGNGDTDTTTATDNGGSNARGGRTF